MPPGRLAIVGPQFVTDGRVLDHLESPFSQGPLAGGVPSCTDSLARTSMAGRLSSGSALIPDATAIGSLVSLSVNVDTEDADKERSSMQCRRVLRRPGWRRVAAAMLPEACTPTHFHEGLSGSCPR